VVEEAGIATVCVSTGRDLTAQVMPPRSLFVNYPMGNNFGAPNDKEMQARILKYALKMVYEVQDAGALVDWPGEWSESFAYFTGKNRKAS